VTVFLSVVVAAVQGAPAVVDCVRALGDDEGVEMVVVDRTGPATRAALAERCPRVRVLPVAATTPLPAMRALGMASAQGERVALIGEHMRAGPGWIAAARGHPDGAVAVLGGPVEAGALEAAAEWAYYLLEYAPFMPPLPAGPVARLAGTNSIYPRAMLEPLGLGDGPVFDSVFQDRARALGLPLLNDPALAVRCEKRLSTARLAVQRYHCGRVSAGQRAQAWTGWRRAAFAAATPLVPPLLLGRLGVALARRGRLRALVPRAAPLVAGVVAGAWGEAVGVLRGAGASAGVAE